MSNSDLSSSSAGVDPSEFRKVLGHFASGVVVVTGGSGGDPLGMTAQSFSSLSLDPPLVLFCPAKNSTTWPRLRQLSRFCVNVLADSQQGVSLQFASSGGDKFSGADWSWSDRGNPLIAGAIAYVECSLSDVHDAGDHEIAVGQVEELRLGDAGHPLLFFRGEFHQLLAPPPEG